MDPNVKFSCSYKPATDKNSSVETFGDVCFICLILAVFLAIGVALHSILLTAFTLIFSALTFVCIKKARLKQFIQVTPTALQIVRSDKKILAQFALKDIMEVSSPDKHTAVLTMYPGSGSEDAEHTLWFVGDADGLLVALSEWGGVHIAGSVPKPQLSESDPDPAQPRVLTDEEADELHAAQHLLNQGMISEQQYSGLLVPPVQQPVPLPAEDINAMNAADYQQRQEQLAQQLGTVPLNTADEKEKDENGRAGFI